MIQKILRKLLKPDYARMTSEQLGLFDKPIKVDNLSENKQQALYKECERLLNDYTFNQIMNELVEDMKNNMLLQTEERNIIYDRFSINGIYLLKERLKLYASKRKTEEEFNKYDIT